MPDRIPKFEETQPLPEVPRFEDTQPVDIPRFEDTEPAEALPSFDQTNDPTVRDEIRAAIPEIVQQLRQSTIQPPQLGEFSPRELSQIRQTGDKTLSDMVMGEESLTERFQGPRPEPILREPSPLARPVDAPLEPKLRQGNPSIDLLRRQGVIRGEERQDLGLFERGVRTAAGTAGQMVVGAGRTGDMIGKGYQELAKVAGDNAALDMIGKLAERAGQATAGAGRAVAEKMAYEDPGNFDKAVGALSSIATFFVPGIGISKVAQALSFAPKLANAFGLTSAALMESSLESGLAFEDAVNEGRTEDEAQEVAKKVFMANIPITVIGNKLGVFANADSMAGKVARSYLAEGTQEAAQEASVNIAAGRRRGEGVGEAFVFGGLAGGVAGAAQRLMTPRQQAQPQGQPPAPAPVAEPLPTVRPAPGPQMPAEAAPVRPAPVAQPEAPPRFEATQPPQEDLFPEPPAAAPVSIPKRNVGKAFRAIVESNRSDLEGVLFNWNDTTLSEDGERIVMNIDRRGAVSGTGPKASVAKSDFFNWLYSDAPFDAKTYQVDDEWTAQINSLRDAGRGFSAPAKIAKMKAPPADPAAVKTPIYKDLVWERDGVQFEIAEPETFANPSEKWEAGVRFGGWAKESQMFNSKAEAIAWADAYDTAKAKAIGPGPQFVDSAARLLEPIEPAKELPKDVASTFKELGFPEDSQVSSNLRLTNLVEMFRGMEGGVPQVVKRFRGRPEVMGKASPQGKIRLHAALGQNEDIASLVLAHEISHVADALYGDTTKTYARGNILGRIGSMNRYLYENLSNNIKTKEEIAAAVKGIKAPLLDTARSEADAQNLKGSARAEFVKQRTKELSSARLEEQGFLSKEKVTKELTELSRWWNQDPDMSPKGIELYAEGMSAYLISPADVAKRAPIFYNATTNWIHKKPEFEKAVMELWANVEKGPAESANRTYNKLVENFAKYSEAKVKAEEEAVKMKDDISLLDRAAMAVDYTIPLTNKMDQYGLKPWDEPFHSIQMWKHSSATREKYLRDIQDNVRSALFESKNLNESMVGAQLLVNRVNYGDRSELLNTLGITVRSAPEIAETIKRQAGDEHGKLMEVVENLYNAHSEVLKDGDGVLNAEGLKKLRDNRFYATFSLTKFIEQQRGGSGLGKVIHPQIGSLEDIGNPLEALVEKDLSLQNTFLRSKAHQAMYEWGTKMGDGSVLPATRTAGGNFESAPAGYQSVYWLWNSKIQGAYVKDDFAGIFKAPPSEQKWYINKAEAALRFFKYLFVNLNPGFFASNPIRDSFFTAQNLEELPFFSMDQTFKFGALESLARTARGIPAAVRHTLGKQTSQAIQNLKALGITQSEYNREFAGATKGLERLLRKNGVLTGDKHDSIGEALLRVMEIALDVGRATDLASKVAAMKLLKEKHPNVDEAWLAHILRTRTGTPDTTNKGALTGLYNWVFMYSQVAFQGWRGNYGAFKDNPQSFSVKMFGQAIMPRLLVLAAGAGLIGYDEENRQEVKEYFDNIPEWFKAGSMVIPTMYRTESGKSVFLTLPQDELTRTVGGITYYLVKNMTETDRNRLLTDVLDSFKTSMDYASTQAPGLNPIIQTVQQMGDIMALPAGEGPRDSFGRHMIPERYRREWEARKGRAAGAYLKNWWNFSGLGMLGKMSDRPEEMRSAIEQATRIPVLGGVLGRFVRVSDVGASTKAYEAKSEASATRQTFVNDWVDRMMDLRNDFVRKEKREPTTREVVGFYREMKSSMPEAMRGVSVADFRRSFTSYTVGLRGNRGRVLSVFRSGSNEAKAAALQRLSKEMKTEEFNALKRQARRDGLLSGKAVSLYRRMEH